VVVQWKLPGSVSVFVQRAGRAARAHGRTGIAILLVEPSAYTIDLEKEVVNAGPAARGHQKSQAKEKKSEAEKRKKAQERKTYAKSRGAKRGAAGGKHDAIFVHDTPRLDPEAPNEGLYVLVQAGTCRRAVLTEIYGNKPARKSVQSWIKKKKLTRTVEPTVPCCDICCPQLLDLTRPGKPPVVPRQSAVKRGEVNADVQAVLHKWRLAIKARDFPTPLFNASAIMRDETVGLLASVGPLMSQDHLAKVLAGQWTWWDRYGEELYACLAAESIPPMRELPKKSRAKRPRSEREGEVDGGSTSKRQRGNEPSISTSTPTPAGSSTVPKTRPKTPVETPEQMRASWARMEENSEQNQRLSSLFTFQTPK
jgi:hypothetical protein